MDIRIVSVYNAACSFTVQNQAIAGYYYHYCCYSCVRCSCKQEGIEQKVIPCLLVDSSSSSISTETLFPLSFDTLPLLYLFSVIQIPSPSYALQISFISLLASQTSHQSPCWLFTLCPPWCSLPSRTYVALNVSSSSAVLCSLQSWFPLGALLPYHSPVPSHFYLPQQNHHFHSLHPP